ncbi:MAG TPA: hypothetical protein VI341_04040 [Actinomycetota bacterium]
MTDDVFDPDRLLTILLQHEVRFVVIGGLAGNLRGTPVVTHDLDVCYDRARDNLEAMASALAAMHATLRVAREDADLAFPLDARALVLGDSFTLRTDFGPFDILGTPSGTSGYEDLVVGATSFEIADGVIVQVSSIEDLIRMKRASARTKDIAQLAHLEALDHEIDRYREEGFDPQQGV